MTGAEPDLDEVVARELALLDPEVRRDPESVRAYLHPDFVLRSGCRCRNFFPGRRHTC